MQYDSEERCWWNGCHRTGHHRAGNGVVCWQHNRELEASYRASLGIPELERQIEQLEAKLEMRLDEWLQLRQRELTSRRREQIASVVYFARMPHLASTHPLHGLIKIGRTTRIEQRMADLGTEVIATIPGGADVERDLHRRFASQRVTGEWFTPTSDLIAQIPTVG